MIYLRFSVVAFLAILTTCLSAWAGTNGYMCTVTTELHLNDDGSLSPYPKPLALGKRFAVDRTTGTMIESSPSWWSVKGEKVSVLSNGNLANRFVVIYTSPAGYDGVFFSALWVEEFAEGVKKPFLLSSDGSVYAGICE